MIATSDDAVKGGYRTLKEMFVAFGFIVVFESCHKWMFRIDYRSKLAHRLETLDSTRSGWQNRVFETDLGW